MLNTKFKYTALEQFIDRQNAWGSFFNTPAMDIDNLSQTQINDLVGSLNSQFSPENLHCDGEISVAEADRKFDYLERVADNLRHLCYVRGLNLPTIHMYG